MTISILLNLALAAGAPEPVVWTKMADPDPTYVAPKASARPKRQPVKAGTRRPSKPDNFESAVVNLMQAADEADQAVMRDYERQVRELEAKAERAMNAVGQAVERSNETVESADPPQR
jgi:hypothetical protein